MLPSYTLALGRTEAVEKFMAFVTSQAQVKETIFKKMEENPFAIGDDNTYNTEREVIEKKKKGGE